MCVRRVMTRINIKRARIKDSRCKVTLRYAAGCIDIKHFSESA